METPQAISVRVPPSNLLSGCCFCCASASQMAFSNPAFDMRCPRIPLMRAGLSDAVDSVFPNKVEAIWDLIVAQLDSIHSELKNGPSPVTDSAQPLIPSHWTVMRSIRRL